MAHWEDDLRAVVEHRGHVVLRHARELLAREATSVVVAVDEAAPEPEPDPALDLTVDALVASFRRHARGRHDDRDGVRIVTDDDLDLLQAAVERAQARLAAGRAPSSAGPEPAPALPDDGPPAGLEARLPEVVARVREARRRARRHAWVGAAAVVAVAVAASAVSGWPWGAGEHGAAALPTRTAPGTTADADPCGSTLPTGGPNLLLVTLDDDTAADRMILPDQTWTAAFRGDAAGLSPRDVAALDAITPEVVLVRDHRVVARGVSPGETGVSLPDGTYDPELAWPGSADQGLTDALAGGDESDDDGDDGGVGITSVGVRFVPCSGGTLEPGDYQAHLFGVSADGSAHVVSEAADLTVLAPTPGGYQPDWLAGSALACGETIQELAARTDRFPLPMLDLHLVDYREDGMAYEFANNTADTQRVVFPRRGAMLWVQDDRIVGVGPDVRADRVANVPAGGTLTVSAAPWDTTDYCADAGQGPRSHLPAGVYRAVGYAYLPAADDGDHAGWFVDTSGLDTVRVAADGTVTADATTDTAAAAGAAATLARSG